MAILIAIEGGDGAGKHSTATRLAEQLNAAGRSATVIAFPRYGETVAGVTIGQFLAGRIDVPVSPHAAAVLYALDRFEWRDAIARAAAAHDVVVFDRYIASNMAYQAAKVPSDDSAALMTWIAALETGQFALPPPTLSVYLDTPWDIARAQIAQKAQRSYTDKSYDAHEADAALQLRVRENYAAMARDGMLSPWHVLTAAQDGKMRTTDAIAAEIFDMIQSLSGSARRDA